MDNSSGFNQCDDQLATVAAEIRKHAEVNPQRHENVAEAEIALAEQMLRVQKAEADRLALQHTRSPLAQRSHFVPVETASPAVLQL